MALMLGGCEPPPPAEFRGRVIDYDTGTGIAGAHVIANYMGSIAWAGTSCDRVESAVADQHGWFTLPLDPDGKPPLLLEAHVPGYEFIHSPRYPLGVGDLLGHWRITITYKDRNDNVVWTTQEPWLYSSERAAESASRRWMDIYVRQLDRSREERRRELARMSGRAACSGGPQTTVGAEPFLESIKREQQDLQLPREDIAATVDLMKYAHEVAELGKSRLRQRTK
jgi:hypothetical protein